MTKKTIAIVVCAVSLCLAFGSKVSDFRLKNLDNKTVRFSELKGEKLTVIDFWATWCKPCVRSIPKLQEIYDSYKDRGVQFVGINVDGTRSLSKVKPMAQSLGMTYPVLLDVNGEIMKQLKVTAIPSIIVVDEDDNVVAFHQGYRPGDDKILADEIQKHLEEKNEKVDAEN